MRTHRAESIKYLLAFGAIYLVWGSTYLAIRYAVEEIPPLLTAAIRHGSGGLILYSWCRMRGLRPRIEEWRAGIVLGALFFLVAHGLLHWAEQVVASGVAALLVATEPLWITLLSGKRPNLRTAGGLAIGFLAVCLLYGADSLDLRSHQWLAGGAVVLGAFFWAVGMQYSRTAQVAKDPILSSSLALLTGGVLLGLASAATGETTGFEPAAVSKKSAWALAYLVVFGSVLAFTAYNWLLKRCSPALVATHTYVNPVVAVFLGWILAGEELNARILFATLLVVFAILLVGRSEPTQASAESANRFWAGLGRRIWVRRPISRTDGGCVRQLTKSVPADC